MSVSFLNVNPHDYDSDTTEEVMIPKNRSSLNDVTMQYSQLFARLATPEKQLRFNYDHTLSVSKSDIKARFANGDCCEDTEPEASNTEDAETYTSCSCNTDASYTTHRYESK